MTTKSKSVLVTGATGYIGSYLTKIIAANGHYDLYAMSRKSPEETVKNNRDTARFKNVTFVQGDCLKPGTYPKELQANVVLHTVGAITDAFDYKKLLKLNPCEIVKTRDPMQAMYAAQGMAQDILKAGESIGKPDYDLSLEAQNRDSTKFIAERFNYIHGKAGTRGLFIFLSAEASILPIPNLRKYAEMKLEAEEYLREDCPNLDVVVLRPGLVYSSAVRPWSVPMGLASTIGSKLAAPLEQFGVGIPAGTPLRAIGDKTLQALKDQEQKNKSNSHDDQERVFKIIGANEMSMF